MVVVDWRNAKSCTSTTFMEIWHHGLQAGEIKWNKDTVGKIRVTWPLPQLAAKFSSVFSQCYSPLWKPDPWTMATIVVATPVHTADGFELGPLSLSVYFHGSVHAEAFPRAIIRWQKSVIGHLLTDKHIANSNFCKACGWVLSDCPSDQGSRGCAVTSNPKPFYPGIVAGEWPSPTMSICHLIDLHP